MIRGSYLPATLLVFDLETVVDSEVCSAVSNCSCKNIQNCDAALRYRHITDTGNPFPKQFFHKIITIGCAIFNVSYDQDGLESYQLVRIGSMSGDEKSIVSDFFQLADRFKPRLISFNGRGFDIPVLKYRALKYELPCTVPVVEGSRYDITWHCDLFDVLSDFGTSSRNIKLHEICSLIGVPGKFGIDGSEVLNMYINNQIQTIMDYCETDVISTYLVYLRYMLRSRKINKDSFSTSTTAIEDFLQASEKQRLQQFYQLWKEKTQEPSV